MGNFSPQVGDHIAHYYTDLGNGSPGWAAGKIRALTKTGKGKSAKYTFTVYFPIDKLNQHGTQLNTAEYGLDVKAGNAWVFLKITDPAQFKAFPEPSELTLAQLFAESSSEGSATDDFAGNDSSSSGGGTSSGSESDDSEVERASQAEMEAQVEAALVGVGAKTMGASCTLTELLHSVRLQDAATLINWNAYDLLHVLNGMAKTTPPKVTVLGDTGKEMVCVLALFNVAAVATTV